MAQFAVDTAFDDLPPAVVAKTKACIMDWLGVTLGGSLHSIADILLGFIEEMGGKDQATIIGRGVRNNVSQAALLNGAMSHVLDYDDVHVGTIGHPSVVIGATILPLGEHLGSSGKEIITSYVVGFDVMARLGRGVRPHHYEKGWHATATLGRFGAAAGAGRLLRLDEQQMVYALGIAGTQTSGFRQVFGTMGKAFQVGAAAADGVQAALLAQRGLTCSESILEGKHGFFDLMAESKYNPDPILEQIGERFEIVEVTFKPHAACGLTHSTIDAVIALREEHHLIPEEIDRIVCEVVPLAMDVVSKEDPKTGLEAKFSLKFCAALALIEGKATQSCFNDDKVNDPTIRSIMDKVEVQGNSALKYEDAPQARVTVESRRQGTLTKRVDQPKGRPKNPLSAQELAKKFLDLATPAIGQKASDRIITEVNQLEACSNIEGLMILCRGPRR
jgi:2-methylcitrate dehydratase PrpD